MKLVLDASMEAFPGSNEKDESSGLFMTIYSENVMQFEIR